MEASQEALQITSAHGLEFKLEDRSKDLSQSNVSLHDQRSVVFFWEPPRTKRPGKRRIIRVSKCTPGARRRRANAGWSTEAIQAAVGTQGKVKKASVKSPSAHVATRPSSSMEHSGMLLDCACKNLQQEFYSMHSGVDFERRLADVEQREEEEFRLGEAACVVIRPYLING